MTKPSVPDNNIAARWFHAMNARSLDALCELAHPELELVPTDYTAPPGTAYHGHVGLRTLADAMWQRYPDLRIDPSEYRQLESSILALCTMARTEGGDGPERIPRAVLFEQDAGLVRRVRVYHTESEALEAAARSAEGGFHAVFDNSEEPILLLSDRGRVVDMNRSGARLLGVSREERIGKDLGDFVGGGREQWDEGWRTLRSEGRATGTLDVRTSGGRRVPVTYWATADFIPGRHLLLLRETEPRDGRAAERLLTAREREVLALLAHGFNSRQIAEKFVLSPATVRTHVQNAVSKLEASTRIQAIAIAIARGEIDGPSA